VRTMIEPLPQAHEPITPTATAPDRRKRFRVIEGGKS
jgi:hypothetical protein